MPVPSLKCPVCGAPLNEPQQPCPQCLLKAALNPLEMPTEAMLEHTETGPVNNRTPAEGTVIGRYKLLQELGEGGFGIVYLAQQIEPVKRRVALKVIKPGMDSREVIARFEAERQALALMDHPNIAQVFDGGTTESGRPYFVMELVKGAPITQYCDDARLDMSQRLELFLDVLAAVQHAHQKGIIHRDLKPTNILVSPHDGKPVIKVIDFGIAKALNIELTEKTLFTGHGRLIGTPEYMSPEQAEVNAADVDTRSDLYSLGVVLYELLTGRTPLDSRRLRQAGYAEIQRMIREEEPPRPSTRLSTLGESLSTVAMRRSTVPLKLAKQVRGELDWIVMKALEKERGRRYETASSFAEDIRRHLADEPVLAGPPSRLYRLRKLAQRNKAVLITAAMVAVALIGGAAVSLWQAQLAHDAQDKAQQAEALVRDENNKRKQQLQEAARTDRLAAMELFDQNRHRDAFALLARACEYDPESTLAAETAVFQLNVVGLAQETQVLVGEGEFPVEPLNRNGWLKRASSKQWMGADDAAFSKDGRHVLTVQLLHQNYDAIRFGNGDFTPPLAALWDAHTGTMLEVLEQPLEDSRIPLWRRAAGLKTKAGVINFDWPWEEDAARGGAVASPDRVSEVAIQNGVATLITNGAEGSKHILSGHRGEIRCARFSTDGQKFVTGADDQALLVRDAQNGSIELVCLGHAAPITNARFSWDGAQLVTCSEDTTARLWETADTRLMTQASDIGEDRLMSVAFTSDGTLLGRTFSQQRFYWDPETGELLRNAKGEMHDERDIGDFRNTGHHFDLTFSDNKGRTLILIDDKKERQQAVFAGHADDILHVRLSPDERWVASHARDKTVRLWDAHSSEAKFVSSPEFDELFSAPGLLFSPDSRQLLVVSRDKNCMLEVPSGRTLFEIHLEENTELRSAEFSPDGRLLVTGDNDATARVWDAATGRILATLDDHPQTVTSVSFSPDGSLLATACWRESVIQVWDTPTWKRVCRINKPGNAMERVIFSPDSRLIAAESDRQDTLNIWDARTGALISDMPPQGADLRSVTFSPNGRQIVTASRTGGALTWEVPGFSGSVPPWFPDFLRLLVQQRVDASGQMRNLSPPEVKMLRLKVQDAAIKDTSRFGEIVRWFLMPAHLRSIRPGSTKTRKDVADHLIVPTAGPLQLRQALRFDPSNALAHHALAHFTSDERSAQNLRRWAQEHLPSPVPAILRERMRKLDHTQEDASLKLPIPVFTHSPDGRFGVTVPDRDQYEGDKQQNMLVENSTRRVLAVIHAETGMEHMNHGGAYTRWSQDSTGLLWSVAGKWFPRALVYLRVKDAQLAWQTDLLGTAQREILSRLRAASPKAYEAVRKENAQDGFGFPDGFTIDVEQAVDAGAELPLRLNVSLTSEPRGFDALRVPLEAAVVASMQGVLELDGSITWSNFQMLAGAQALRREAFLEGSSQVVDAPQELTEVLTRRLKQLPPEKLRVPLASWADVSGEESFKVTIQSPGSPPGELGGPFILRAVPVPSAGATSQEAGVFLIIQHCYFEADGSVKWGELKMLTLAELERQKIGISRLNLRSLLMEEVLQRVKEQSPETHAAFLRFSDEERKREVLGTKIEPRHDPWFGFDKEPDELQPGDLPKHFTITARPYGKPPPAAYFFVKLEGTIDEDGKITWGPQTQTITGETARK